MVTIKDVAKECGVAISTVSNVLNQVDNVSDETKKKVLAAVEKLKYVPNMNAKYLKSSKKNTVGLFLSSIQGDFYKSLTQAIHFQCKINSYMLNIYVSNENTSEEIYGMIISSGVEGAIIMNESLTDEYVERLSYANMPLVFIDRELKGPGISSVTINNEAGAALGMEYLIRLGHRRIGYIHGLENHDDDGRYRAYLQVMKRYQLPVDEAIILRGYFEESVAFSEMNLLLKRQIEIPDAFFCANDEMAWGCIRALNLVGLQVPSQISVIGFDDTMLAPYYNPPLTTIHSPVVELGSQGALELIRLIREGREQEGRSTKLEPTIVTRGSCTIRI